MRGRVLYQDQVAALYALTLLEPNPEYRAIYLEWHEDFLLVNHDDKLTPVQVKSRDPHLPEIGLGDDLFHGVLKGFLDKDRTLGTRVTKFIFASERSVSSALTRAMSTAQNPLRSPRGDWMALWEFLHAEYPDVSRDQLSRQVASVMNRISVDQQLPKRADAMARIENTFRRLFPLLGHRSADDLTEMASSFVQEIASRSRERYDLLAQIQRSTADGAVQDQVAANRCLDAAEVRRILELPLVGARSNRRQRARSILVSLLSKIPVCDQLVLAAGLALPIDVPTPLTEALADAMLAAPLESALKAISGIGPDGDQISRTLCLVGFLSDVAAQRANDALDTERGECVGACTSGRFGQTSGRGYVESARLSHAPWRAIPLDEQVAEWSDETLLARLKDSLTRGLNDHASGIPLGDALRLLQQRGIRVVVIATGKDAIAVIGRTIAALPAEARVLYVGPAGADEIPAEFLTLPSPDPVAEAGYCSCSL